MYHDEIVWLRNLLYCSNIPSACSLFTATLYFVYVLVLIESTCCILQGVLPTLLLEFMCVIYLALMEIY